MAANKNNITDRIKRYTKIMFCVKFLRYFFFFYAFISFIFWFLNCLEVEWIYLFEKLFILPYMLVHLVYSPTGVSADYSLAIIGGISVLLGFFCEIICNLLIQKLDRLEEEKEKVTQLRKIKERNKQKRDMISAQNEAALASGEQAKLVFLIMPNVRKIRKSQNDLELTFQEVEIWKQRVNKKFLENVIYSNPRQKGYYRKNLFLMYNDFGYVDEFIYYIRPTLDSIMMEFKKYGVSVSFCFALSSILSSNNLEKELDCMDTILSLNFTNEIVVTNNFRLTYENRAIKQYYISLKGEYNLSKNLAVLNRQSLYILIDKKKAGESV